MLSTKAVKQALKNNPLTFKVFYPLLRAYRVNLMRLFQRVRGIRADKVVFSSFDSDAYSDNPRYISERLHALKPDCDIVWLISKNRMDRVKTPDYVRRVTPLGLDGLYEQATARFWVDNSRHAENIYLNDKKQYYIQTWHGDRGFKRVGVDDEKKAVYLFEDRCAMMIAGSEFGRNTYRTAFRYQGPVLMDGCPRNDLLMRNDPALVAVIRARMDLPEGVRVLMYAPTYRRTDNRGRQKAVLDIPRTLDHLEKKTGAPWRCLYRAHYKMAGLIANADDARMIDASGYPEMTELLLISDMLITDYSSCGGDFALLRRPVFLYQADVDEYLKDDHSFYFRMEDSPFLIAHDQAELEALIDTTDAQKARENCEALDRFFGTTETGHATDAVCRYIIERMQG